MEKLDSPSDLPTIPMPLPSIHPIQDTSPPLPTISPPHPPTMSMALDHLPSAKSTQSVEATTPLQQFLQLPTLLPQMPKWWAQL